MSLALGQQLNIRAMAYVAAEPIPFFWPMRAFIHHNPLHGLEHLPFEDAVQEGRSLFHGRGFLPRSAYQTYLAEGQVDETALRNEIAGFLENRPAISELDLQAWLLTLARANPQRAVMMSPLTNIIDIQAALNGDPLSAKTDMLPQVKAELRIALSAEHPLYETVDALYGTDIANELDELVIKGCLDFFDEGQSVWQMPGRKQGFFRAWREVARRNAKFFLRGVHIDDILAADDTPEGVIAGVMGRLKVPEKQWAGYFTRELARLHGWAGFVRWRSSAKHYYWNQRYPADLVDLLAVRLTLATALLKERGHQHTTAESIEAAIDSRPNETYLRYELHSGKVLPAFATKVEQALALGRAREIQRVFDDYVRCKRRMEATGQAKRLLVLAEQTSCATELRRLPTEDLGNLIETLREFERREGMMWLRAMESRAMSQLVHGVNLAPSARREKRPFVQAMFCIDTRSERIRRHLETVGDYQTFGIAGFFGVPISFVELGKGSESHLCPVLLTPKHLVLEMTTNANGDIAAVTAFEKLLHELKESVLSPFVTVEAIGLLFGFDMVGKTLMPRRYNRWRKHLHEAKPSTHLLLDKLSREQADSIVRAAQRAVIVKAVEQEFKLEAEHITDTMIRELREAALGKQGSAPEFSKKARLDEQDAKTFIHRLREVYRIDPAFAQLQMEHLGRIGFSLDEQVNFVSQSLRAIGLTENFSRFILLVGHGSTSDNNPYESALDCGACGGNQGLVNARALAQMANKAEVRQRLRAQGIGIADDAWFIPALHNTTTDELQLFDLDRIPSSHVVYIDRLRNGLTAASRRCAQERLPSLQIQPAPREPVAAFRTVQRNAMDWSQVRPEWGLARNAYFVIGRRDITSSISLEGRAFLHSYDYRVDPKRRLLENILTGPLVVGQWINMEHYFSTVDNERYGSGSKVYHNVAGRFGVMTGNLSDLRTGLPAQTVLDNGRPYHQPLRLITVIEAPLKHAQCAVDAVATVKQLVNNDWIRLLVIDPEQSRLYTFENGDWLSQPLSTATEQESLEEVSSI